MHFLVKAKENLCKGFTENKKDLAKLLSLWPLCEKITTRREKCLGITGKRCRTEVAGSTEEYEKIGRELLS
jgi:hypothetical protein